MKKLLIAILCTAVVLGTSLFLNAAETPADKPAEKKAPKKEQGNFRPFNGVIKSVDSAAKTITLEGEKAQTFSVTSTTRILKEGKPATFDDLKATDKVGGRAKEAAEGKWEAVNINVGVKSAKGDKGKKKEEKK